MRRSFSKSVFFLHVLFNKSARVCSHANLTGLSQQIGHNVIGPLCWDEDKTALKCHVCHPKSPRRRTHQEVDGAAVLSRWLL